MRPTPLRSAAPEQLRGTLNLAGLRTAFERAIFRGYRSGPGAFDGEGTRNHCWRGSSRLEDAMEDAAEPTYLIRVQCVPAYSYDRPRASVPDSMATIVHPEHYHGWQQSEPLPRLGAAPRGVLTGHSGGLGKEGPGY